MKSRLFTVYFNIGRFDICFSLSTESQRNTKIITENVNFIRRRVGHSLLVYRIDEDIL